MYSLQILTAYILPIFAVTSTSGFNTRTAAAPFTLIAAHSGSPVHLQAINATEGGFHIGQATTTYCPPDTSNCPPGNVTALRVRHGAADLDVSVPNGQTLYVGQYGALSFNPPGSDSIPANATAHGFSHISGDDGGPGRFSFTGAGSNTFLACPSNGPGGQPYEVFANVTGLGDENVPGGNLSACISIDALAYPYPGGIAAYEYR